MSRPPPPPVDMVFVRNVSNKSDKTLTEEEEEDHSRNPFYDDSFRNSNNGDLSWTGSNDLSASNTNDENFVPAQNEHFSPVKPLYKKENSGTFSQYTEPFEMEPPFLNSTLSNLALDSPSQDNRNESFHTAPSNDETADTKSEDNHLSFKGSLTELDHTSDFINSGPSPDNPFAGDNKPLYPEPIRLINTNSSEEYETHAHESNNLDQYSFDNSIVEGQIPRKHESVKEMQNVSIMHSSSDDLLGSKRKEQRFRVINQDRPSFYVNHDDEDGDEDEDEDEDENDAPRTGYFTHEDVHSFNYENSEQTPPLYYKSPTDSTSSMGYDHDEHESSLLDANSALKTPMHTERANSNFGRNSFASSSSFPAKTESDQNGRPRLHTQQISSASFKFPIHANTEDHEVIGGTSETTSSSLPHSTPGSVPQSKFKSFDEAEGNSHLGNDQQPYFNSYYVSGIPETPVATQVPESILSGSSGGTSGGVPLDNNNLSPVTRSATLTTGALRDTGGKISLVSEYVEELRYKYFPTANVVQPPPNLPLSIKSKNTLELPQSSNIKVKIRTSSKQIGIKHGKAKQKLLSLEAPAEEDEYSDAEDPLNLSFNGNEGYIPTAEEEEERLILSELPGDEAYNGDDLMAPLRERHKTTVSGAKNGNAKNRVSRSDSTKSYFTKNAHRFRSGTLDNSYVPPMGNIGNMGTLPQLPSNQAIPLYKGNVITDPVTPTSSNMSGYNKNTMNDEEVMREIEQTYKKPTNNDHGKWGSSNTNTKKSRSRTDKHGSLVSADFYHQDLINTGSSLKVANPDHEY
ncbi:hypothetical protein ACO0QE_002586 [Hanseniaspora vineae]